MFLPVTPRHLNKPGNLAEPFLRKEDVCNQVCGYLVVADIDTWWDHCYDIVGISSALWVRCQTVKATTYSTPIMNVNPRSVVIVEEAPAAWYLEALPSAQLLMNDQWHIRIWLGIAPSLSLTSFFLIDNSKSILHPKSKNPSDLFQHQRQHHRFINAQQSMAPYSVSLGQIFKQSLNLMRWCMKEADWTIQIDWESLWVCVLSCKIVILNDSNRVRLNCDFF